MKRLMVFTVVALLAMGFSPTPAGAITSTQVPITSSVGNPDRGDTGLAIDGDISTATYTTPSNNQVFPSYLEFGFASTRLTRIRYIKDDYVGPFNLTIQYTTSTDSDLSARIWNNVSGLTNGFQGNELLSATSVNSDGTVTGDNQDSTTNWASLSFTPVTATGVRIGFSGSNPCCNHYHVYEFQAYNDGVPGTVTVTSPNGGEIWAVGTVHRITWTFAGAPADARVRITLREAAGRAVTLSSRSIGTNGVGSYRWTVPNVTRASDYRITVGIIGGASDSSDGTFTIS